MICEIAKADITNLGTHWCKFLHSLKRQIHRIFVLFIKMIQDNY